MSQQTDSSRFGGSRLLSLAYLFWFVMCSSSVLSFDVSRTAARSVRRSQSHRLRRTFTGLHAAPSVAETDCTDTETSVELEHKVPTMELPPVIQSIKDERREFQMHLGKAMDTLRTDMQDILHRQPDYSIYHKDIRVVDPSGVQLQGLDKYKQALRFLQTFIGFWFSNSSTTSTQTGLQFRMVYDFCRSEIRVAWNIALEPKLPLGRTLHVDGVSYYRLDAASGKITEHRIEKLVVNNSAIEPPYGILSLLQQQESIGMGLQPAGAGAGLGGL